jgi:hypothetical protein
VQRSSGFFQGSELPRLLMLALVVLLGWGLVWHFAHKLPDSGEPPVTVTGKPEPVIPDRSMEFETVKDRAPLEFRDNAAYALLLSRARGKNPTELAAVARRDLVLAHLWKNPELYRGVPIHLLGTAMRVLRYPSKLSETGWLYEAWIMTPETTRMPYVCVFEEAPEGFPIGHDVNERVVFNGYFLKIMKYQAGDVARGAPLVVGRIGWTRREASPSNGTNTTLLWSLVVLGGLFFVSLGRWMFQLRRLFTAPRTTLLSSPTAGNDEIDPAALGAWARSMAPQVESSSEEDDSDES